MPAAADPLSLFHVLACTQQLILGSHFETLTSSSLKFRITLLISYTTTRQYDLQSSVPLWQLADTDPARADSSAPSQ